MDSLKHREAVTAAVTTCIFTESPKALGVHIAHKASCVNDAASSRWNKSLIHTSKADAYLVY